MNQKWLFSVLRRVLKGLKIEFDHDKQTVKFEQGGQKAELTYVEAAKKAEAIVKGQQ